MFNRTLLKWREPGLQRAYLQKKKEVSKQKRIVNFLLSILGYLFLIFLGGILEAGVPESSREWWFLLGISLIFGLGIFAIMLPIQAFANSRPVRIYIREKRIERRSWTAWNLFPYKDYDNFSFLIIDIDGKQTDALALFAKQTATLLELSNEIRREQIQSVLEPLLPFEPVSPLGTQVVYDEIAFDA